MLRRAAARFGALLATAGALACAPVSPSLSGGSTTPAERVDVAVGGAARVPLGALGTSEAAGETGDLAHRAAPGGVAPVALGRIGLSDHVDVGLAALGAGVRAEARVATVFDRGSTLRPGLVLGGAVHGEVPTARGAGRLGAELSGLFVLDAESLVELWVGPRVGLAGTFVAADPGAGREAIEATTVSVGGVLGLGLGFRSLHALAELGAGWERLSGSRGGAPVAVSGLVLVPAFALRLRI